MANVPTGIAWSALDQWPEHQTSRVQHPRDTDEPWLARVRRCRRLVLLLFVFVAIVGCAKSPEHPERTVPRGVMRVVIQQDGVVLVDDVRTAVDALRAQFAALKQRRGTVWCYRANPGDEPPPHALEVLKLAVDAQLPVRLFVTADFSEYLGSDGRRHAR